MDEKKYEFNFTVSIVPLNFFVAIAVLITLIVLTVGLGFEWIVIVPLSFFILINLWFGIKFEDGPIEILEVIEEEDYGSTKQISG